MFLVDVLGSSNVEIIEMDCMCCLIVDYMVNFKYILLYVIFFVEVDVILIVEWCNCNKYVF